MSNRHPVDNAIAQHLHAAAQLMIARCHSAESPSTDNAVIGRLDLILAKLGTPAEYPLTWVKLNRYVELSGDSMDAVQARRRLGKWIDGKHCKIVDGRLWVDLRAAQRWVEEWKLHG